MPFLRKIKLSFVREKKAYYGKVKNVHDVVDQIKTLFGDLEKETQEVFYVIHLDGTLNIVGYHEAFRGTSDSCNIDPKIIFQATLLSGAHGVIFVHNHPSDDPNPSEGDIRVTKNLAEAGKLLDVDIIDHIIISPQGYYSFKREGQL